MKDGVGLVLFCVALYSLVGCAAPAPTTAPTTIPRESDPTLQAESLDTKPICSIQYAALPPLTPSAPHALLSVMQDARTTIVAVNADGETAPLTEPRAIGRIQLASDGSTLAYQVLPGPHPANNYIVVRALETGHAWRIASGEGCAIFGFTLDPTGKRIAILQVAMRGRFKPAAWQVAITDPTGGARVLRGESETALVPFAWSAATDTIFFRAIVPFQASGWRGVWRAQPDGSNLRLLLRESDFVGEPILSPDGRWLAYLASDADRLPKEYIAGVGEPPANRIAAINLMIGETRALAETAQSLANLAWSQTRVLFTEGRWEDNRFRYDAIRVVNVNASLPETLMRVETGESIVSAQMCADELLLYTVRRKDGNALRWQKDGRVKTLASAPNVEYRTLGCAK